MTTTLEVERPTGSDASHHLIRGTSSPLGATPCRDGVNFSIFSRHAIRVELLLFDHVDDGAEAARVIRIDPAFNRTYHYWHLFAPGVKAGQLYGYRIEGPWDPAQGIRQDGFRVYLILNAYSEPLDFELPPLHAGGASSWRRWIDTALESPLDIVRSQTAPSLSGPTYRAAAHSVVVLFAEIRRGGTSG